MKQQYEFEPNWAPLEILSDKYPNEINACDYMYMGTVSGINLYKNNATRRYLNIDGDGILWKYDPNGSNYFQITEKIAIRRVNS